MAASFDHSAGNAYHQIASEMSEASAAISVSHRRCRGGTTNPIAAKPASTNMTATSPNAPIPIQSGVASGSTHELRLHSSSPNDGARTPSV